MCSICGGTRWGHYSRNIWEKAQDRGRDDQGMIIGRSGGWIGNRRATPTTEVEIPTEKQPVGIVNKLVFNGIISNDDSYLKFPGEADTSVLPRVLNFTNLIAFRDSIEQKLIGSYAIAVLIEDSQEIWLAANYKPIWIAEWEGEFFFSSLKAHFPYFMNPYRMPPYSVQSLTNRLSTIPIHRTQGHKALVICSAGLDSTAVAAFACSTHLPENTTLLHFDYGCQATSKEIECIKKIALYFHCKLDIIKMTSFGGSSLLEEHGEISEGIKGAEYAHEWVPARNLMMLAHATAYAEAKGYGHIYLGTNLEEAGAYPDNEEQFILDFNSLLWGAVQNGTKIEIHTPLGGLMKHEIIPFGLKYNAPFELTWSCYRAGEHHCGKCGPDFMRRTAFKRNGLIDPVFDSKDPFWEGCVPCH